MAREPIRKRRVSTRIKAQLANRKRDELKKERNDRILKGNAVTKKKTKIRITKNFIKDVKKKRMENMTRDAARYALLDLVEDETKTMIILSRVRDDKKVKITFKKDKSVNCNCIDWRVRCKKYGISCKHLLYVMDRILKVDLDLVVKNVLKSEEIFRNAIKKLNLYHLTKKGEKFIPCAKKTRSEEDLCVICFSDFIYTDKNDFVLKVMSCPECNNLVHKDCMVCWLKNSWNKSCVYCRSAIWSDLL